MRGRQRFPSVLRDNQCENATVLSLEVALVVFGLAQWCGASGFLATYLAGVATAAARAVLRWHGLACANRAVLDAWSDDHAARIAAIHSSCHSQNGATPAGAPVAVFRCLTPFRFILREITFASWVGSHGAVPICLSLIPGLVDPQRDEQLFAKILIVVMTSLWMDCGPRFPIARPSPDDQSTTTIASRPGFDR
jgi:potassium/hydrogen antiporter